MRTTLNLDRDVLNAARRLAGRQRCSLGEAISTLARKGLRGDPDMPAPASRNGFPLFATSAETPLVTPGDIGHGEGEDEG